MIVRPGLITQLHSRLEIKDHIYALVFHAHCLRIAINLNDFDIVLLFALPQDVRSRFLSML